MRTRRVALALVCLVVAAGIGVRYWTTPPTTTSSAAAVKGKGKKGAAALRSTDPVPVLAIDARAADVPVYLDGVGTAKALNTVTVRPQVDGKLTSVQFTEGMEVPKGYVLAQIDPVTYQAQYDQAVAKKGQDEAQLANARLDLERYMRLAATNAVNKQQVDTQRALVAQLEATVEADQAMMDNAHAILSYTQVIAPIAGRTGIRMIDEGNIVHASDSTGIVVITQLQPISVLFNLPQQQLPEVNRGLAEGPLPVDALGPDGKAVVDKGKVLVVDNQVDQTTGTVKLKAEFKNTAMQLWPGQFVNVRVLINTLRQVIVVPTAAVQRGPNGTFVYVATAEGKATVRPVTLAQQDDVQSVLASGLQAGERVVTTGFARLTEGTAVSVSSAEDAGQLTPAARARPDGTRGSRSGERGRRSPGARPPAGNP